MKKTVLTITVGALILIAPLAEAASIWKNAQAGKKMELFTSQEREWKRHDLVRVMIIENTKATHGDDTDVKDRTSFVSELTDWFRWDFGASKPILANTMPKIGYNTSKKRLVEASVEKDSTFRGQITAEVLEVMPNGNLVLTAKKEIRIGKDMQTIKFTGLIAPRDIDEDNQVLSTQVANARIEFGGSGPVSDAQKEGLLARLIGKFWIF